MRHHVVSSHDIHLLLTNIFCKRFQPDRAPTSCSRVIAGVPGGDRGDNDGGDDGDEDTGEDDG